MSPEMGWGALRDPVPWGTPAAGLPRAPRACLEKPAGWNGMAEGRGATRGGGASAPAVPQHTFPSGHVSPPLARKVPSAGGAVPAQGQGEASPYPPRGSSLCHLPTPSCSFSSFPFQPFLSPAFLPFPLLSAPLPSVHPRVIYFFPWQLYNPFPCLTAIKQMLRFQSHGP